MQSGGRYALATWLFLRLLGLVFLAAFVSLWGQVDVLMGPNGLAPAEETVRAMTDVELDVLRAPSLAWWGASVGALKTMCAVGALCSVLLASSILSGPALLACWALYLSLVTIGEPFTSFQWDALLLEAGITALFVAPFRFFVPLRKAQEPFRFGRWLLYALTFRLMFSSGVVKLASGDPTWRNFTALSFHYETQPLPTALGWFAHQAPAAVHAASTVLMFGIELIVPFLIFSTRTRRIAAALLIALQLGIAATGNYGFFNVLTVALCIPLLDDEALRHFLRFTGSPTTSSSPGRVIPRRLWAWGDPSARDSVVAAPRRWVHLLNTGAASLFALLTAIMFAVTLFGAAWVPRPALDVLGIVRPFRSINGYGLFAVMTTTRPEIVIEGSADGHTWKEYVFRYKPGPLTRAPTWSAPHMPRVDWQMWFAALGDYRSNPWLLRLMAGLLEGNQTMKSLFVKDPFESSPPRYVRAVVYEYRFTDIDTLRSTGRWWRRSEARPYTPVLAAR